LPVVILVVEPAAVPPSATLAREFTPDGSAATHLLAEHGLRLLEGVHPRPRGLAHVVFLLDGIVLVVGVVELARQDVPDLRPEGRLESARRGERVRLTEVVAVPVEPVQVVDGERVAHHVERRVALQLALRHLARSTPPHQLHLDAHHGIGGDHLRFLRLIDGDQRHALEADGLRGGLASPAGAVVVVRSRRVVVLRVGGLGGSLCHGGARCVGWR